MKNLFTLMFTLMTLTSFAQIQLDSTFSLSGSVDTYFRANLNSTNDGTNGGTMTPTNFGALFSSQWS